MPDDTYNLAIEMSGPTGSITLGCGDELIDSAETPARRPGEQRVDLMPTAAALCEKHTVHPDQLAEVYISIGPGSFTGLRIAVTTAKFLAAVGGAKLVAVPTLGVIVQNVVCTTSRGQHTPDEPQPYQHAAACLAVKRAAAYCAAYSADDGQWFQCVEPAIRPLRELLTLAPHPIAVVGWRGDVDESLANDDSIVFLPPQAAAAHSDALWRLGRNAASRGQFIDVHQLLPLYARRPEAELLWDQRHPAP